MTRQLVGIFLLLIISLSGNAQKMHFQHITSSDGLSQSEVYSFLEDSKGFMWFGTLYGLNRYDGYNILNFHTERGNPNSLSNNTVRSLKEDHMGRIWIGTENGLNVWDMETETIHHVKIPESLDKRLVVYSIIFDGQNLLISTSTGILRTNIESEDLEIIENGFKRIHYSDNVEETINLIRRDKNGMIWVSVNNSLYSLAFLNENDDPIIVDHISDSLFSGSVRDMAFDHSNNLWLTTHSNGFYRYNTVQKTFDYFSKGIPNETVITSNTSSVVSDALGNIWIGTRDRGLLFLPKESINDENPEFQSIQKDPFNDRSLNSNLIYSLYFSKSNLLWVGTVGSGVNVYDLEQKAFNYYRIPPVKDGSQSGSNFIRSVFSDHNDHIWIGTHNSGLYRFNREKNEYTKMGFDTQSIFYITSLNKDHLIVCTSSGVSLARIGSDGTLKIIPTDIKAASFYALKSQENIIWIASIDGLYSCQLVDGQLTILNNLNTQTKPAISINNTRVLYFSEDSNELFLGTEGGGLNIISLNKNHEPERVTIYKKGSSPTSLSSNFIRTIIKNKSGDLWIGTYEGLNKVIEGAPGSPLTFQAYTIEDGLPNNMIQLMVEDEMGNIWIGTNRGLSKFNPVIEKFIPYTKTDGIQSNEFSEHAVYQRSDGEIIVGGTHGFNTFYPEKIKPSSTNPNTTVTAFFISNEKIKVGGLESEESTLTKSITATDSLFLSPDQNNLGFEFSSLIYSNPDKVQYAYMLEGFDKTWNYTDANNRRINYTNLDYGKYVFKVKSTNNDGEWEESSRDIYVLIDTPFYLTWVAYLFYVIIIAIILVYFANYSVIKYTTKKKILLENEHNLQLHELDLLRTRFFINISHDLRTPLTLISSPLSLVLKDKDLKEETRKRLELANRNVQKLRYITEQLLDISKAEAGKLIFKPENNEFISFIKMELSHFTDAIRSKGLGIHVITDYDSISCRIDSDMISKTFFNILSNAIKYTKEGEINIRVDLVTNQAHEKLHDSQYNHFIKLEIQDSGKGISTSELDKIFDRFYQGHNKDVDGYGIGLSHCKDLIEAHQGIIEASSSALGTTFRIFIPHLEPLNSEKDQRHAVHSTPEFYVKSPLDVKSSNGKAADAQKETILVIEDNSDMRSFIKDELQREYKVVEAEDGMDGLAMAEKYAPDLVVSDIMMPHMDGIEFCKQLKADIKTSHIPVILLTAEGDTKTKYKSIEIGADDYLSKPFEIDYLVLRIKNLLNSKEVLRNAFQADVKLSPSSIEMVSLDNKFLSELMTAIEEGISDPDFTVNTLESKMGMSHTNFYRKIKTLTGKSGKEILMDMRMKRAKQILADNEGIRISDVAYNVGFSNPKYFSKCFKEYYGVLPSDVMNK